jgi:uncharacterized protein DUF6878
MNEVLEPADQAIGPSLLHKLLPDAHRFAETMGTLRPTPVRADLMALLTETNVDDVRLRKGTKGGYLAEILLKDVAVGLPRVVGTDCRTPHTTPELAMEHAKRMLAEIVRSKPAAPASQSQFRLDIRIFVLTAEELQAAASELMTVQDARANLAAIHDKYIIQSLVGFHRSYDALPTEERREISSAMCQGAVNGILEYPPNDDAGYPLPEEQYAGLTEEDRQNAEAADANRRFEKNKSCIFNRLAAIDTVTCTYSDSGDKVNTDDIKSSPGELPETPVLYAVRELRLAWNEMIGAWGHYVAERWAEGSVEEAIESLSWEVLEDLHGGCEIDYGGNGDFVLDILKRTIVLTHHQAYVEYITTEDEV